MTVDKKALWQQALVAVGVAFAVKGTPSYDKVMEAFKQLVSKAEEEERNASVSSSPTSKPLAQWADAVKQVTSKGYVVKGTQEYEQALQIYHKMKAAEVESDPVKACWRKACLDKAKREIVMKQDPEYAEVKSYFRELLAASAGPS